MQCNVCKGWNTEHGQCWDCHCEEVMAEIEREFKRQNRWYKRLWRWVRGKDPIINVTQYSTYSNEPVEMPTMDDLVKLAEAMPPPPPKIVCTKHGRVTGVHPDKNGKIYCSVCVDEWQLEFMNQFSHAESVDDLRMKPPTINQMRQKYGFTGMSMGVDGVLPVTGGTVKKK